MDDFSDKHLSTWKGMIINREIFTTVKHMRSSWESSYLFTLGEADVERVFELVWNELWTGFVRPHMAFTATRTTLKLQVGFGFNLDALAGFSIAIFAWNK